MCHGPLVSLTHVCTHAQSLLSQVASIVVDAVLMVNGAFPVRALLDGSDECDNN